MTHITELRLTGPGKPDAIVRFERGPNVITGDSDTGKSYIVRCIDFVLGATELTKIIEQANGYELVWLELRNSNNQKLTLTRHLSGGDVRAYSDTIESVLSRGQKSITPSKLESSQPSNSTEGEEVLKWKRTGTSKARDVTSRLLPFLGMPDEIRLRINESGTTQRLTVRTLLPMFILDEDTIIKEKSLVLGDGYGETARKRMLSYLLTGNDDSAIIAQEKKRYYSS